MAAHTLAGAENSAKALDVQASQEVLVERLAMPAVDTTYRAAALFGSERSRQRCHCRHVQAFHSWDRNACEQGRVYCSSRRPA